MIKKISVKCINIYQQSRLLPTYKNKEKAGHLTTLLNLALRLN
jgi:hypothetical protein